jgi:aryl-alcohol dehydrogenase-like predicted oxidoreductase
VVPIPGTSSIKRLEENAAAAGILLSRADLDRIEQISPKGAVVGGRYDKAMLGLVNK